MAEDDDPFVRELEGMIAAAAADAAALERRRELGMRQAAEEGATFAGVLVDLAERRAPVTLRTTLGRTHVGTISAVGADFVVLRPSGSEAPVLVRTTAVASLRPVEATGADAAAERPPPLGVGLAGVLVGLVPDRPRLRISVPSEEALTGELRSCGADVVTLLLDESRGPGSGAGRLGRTVHVPLAAVVEVTLLG